MNPPPALRVTAQELNELIAAMQEMRDALLNASWLLQDYLYETDHAAREQARQIAETLIHRSRSG